MREASDDQERDGAMSNCALRPTLNILLNADVLPKRNVKIMLVLYFNML